MILLENEYVIKATAFFVASLFGMLYAYCWKWVENPKNPNLIKYLFGNKQATVKAFLVLIGSSIGMLSLDYLNQLDLLHLIVAGTSLGLLTPQKVDNVKL